MKRRGGEKRGNSYDRRARKLYLLSEHAGFGGNGTRVPCTWCGMMLTYETLQSDRLIPGGSYRRDNVVPACTDCNTDRNFEALTPHTLTHHPMTGAKLI